MPLFMRFVFAALGVGIIAGSFWLRAMNRRANRWPHVEGEIVRSRLVNDSHNEDPVVELRYRYSVAGRDHLGERVAFAARIARWSGAIAKERRFAFSTTPRSPRLP